MIAVVLVLSGIGANLLVFNSLLGGGAARVNAIVGGPKPVREASESLDREALLTSSYAVDEFEEINSADGVVAGLLIVEDALILNSTNPITSSLPSRDGLLVYRVGKGDTLSKIAADFGVSLNTILWANKDLRRILQPGQEIVILPVSGILHQVQEGETIESIAGLYGVSYERIISVNKASAGELLASGRKIIIPDARPRRSLTSGSENLPNLNSYFALPTTGWNWGELHPVNAVDIANACGTPIYAAAEGLVIEVESPASWNSGYGGNILIEHPNGVKTRYAHIQKSFVAVGDYINQRELIAEIGNTGNVHGNPGCHLHFEVKGARNPLAK